jgi:hypothetical protein
MKSKSSLICVAGAALMIIGNFLPWVSVLGVSTTGSGTGAGMFIIVMAALIALLAFLGKRWGIIISLILTLLSVAWAAKQLSDVGSITGASAGVGLYAILIGAVIAMAGCFMGFGRRAEPIEATA